MPDIQHTGSPSRNVLVSGAIYARSCQAWTKLQVNLEDGDKVSPAVNVRGPRSRTHRLTETLLSRVREGGWFCGLCEDFLQPRLEDLRGNNVVRTNSGHSFFVSHFPLAHIASHPRPRYNCTSKGDRSYACSRLRRKLCSRPIWDSTRQAFRLQRRHRHLPPHPRVPEDLLSEGVSGVCIIAC